MDEPEEPRMPKHSLALEDFYYTPDPGVAARHKSISNYDFSPVRTDNLAYALTVFVSAANGKLRSRVASCSALRQSSILECERLFLILSSGPRRRAMDRRSSAYRESTLPVAFAAVWNEYLDDVSRDSICARVLGFYYLMERTAGKAMVRWIEACPAQPEAVALDLVVVHGLANVPLSSEGHLSQALLLEVIGLFEKESN
jgi:hypothetical protein